MKTILIPHWGTGDLPPSQEAGREGHKTLRDREVEFDERTGEACIVFPGELEEVPLWLAGVPTRLWVAEEELPPMAAPPGKFVKGDTVGYHELVYDRANRASFSYVWVMGGDLAQVNAMFLDIECNNACLRDIMVERTCFGAAPSLSWCSPGWQDADKSNAASTTP